MVIMDGPMFSYKQQQAVFVKQRPVIVLSLVFLLLCIATIFV